MIKTSLNERSTMYDCILKAPYYLEPQSFTILKNKALCIRAGMIEHVCDQTSTPEAKSYYEFDNALILPAFVNCHTHLDLSHLRGVPLQGDDFAAWLQAVVQARSAPQKTIQEALALSLKEMKSQGTAAFVDILSPTPSSHELAAQMFASGLESLITLELLPFQGQSIEATFQACLGVMQRVLLSLLDQAGIDFETYSENTSSFRATLSTDARPLHRLGLSPHAPYTVPPELYVKAAHYAKRFKLLQTTHFAESAAERDYVIKGEGLFTELFEKLGFEPCQGVINAQPPFKTLMEKVFPELETGINHHLLVHCYDLQENEIQELGKHQAHIVYCPRSRAYFNHSKIKLQSMLAAGIRVCLGSDSLGSTPDLDMLGELRQAQSDNPNISALELFRIASINGRFALWGRNQAQDQKLYGLADLQVRSLPESSQKILESGDRFFQALFEERPSCLATFVAGKPVYLEQES